MGCAGAWSAGTDGGRLRLLSPLAIVARSVRYLVPIAVLCAIVWLPIGVVAFGVKAPPNAKLANVVLRIVWVVATSGMLAVLVLVGALAPILRGERVSQLVALGRGLRGLVRALVPAAIVTCAVLMGLLALAVPGVLLYMLLVFAPASEAAGIEAKLAESIAIVRAKWRAIAVAVGLTMVALAAVVAVQQLMLPIPLGKSPPTSQLMLFPAMVRQTAIAMEAIVPAAAIALAAIHESARATR